MIVKRFITNELAANCYVVHSGSDAIVVDPGGESQEVLNYLQEQSLNVIALVNTHGHADHIGGNTWFVKKTGAPVWIHELDAPYLADESLNLARFVGQEFEPMTAGRLLHDGDEIELGGRSNHSAAYAWSHPRRNQPFWPGHVITGDTLFEESAGRTDLPGGNSAQLGNSLLRLAACPSIQLFYPGHGESTTIRHEIMLNPFL